MNETYAWRDNPVWHQLLCLLPLLGVTNNVADAVVIGIATLAVLVTSNVIITALRSFIPAAASLPAYTLLIGMCTTSVMMLMQVYAFDAHQRVALFVQIILCNCIVLTQAERTARQNTIGAALIHTIAGVGFFAMVLLVGAMREGAPGSLPPSLLPACVFFVAALLLAAKNVLAPRV